jgi:2'-5' RNA ligase
MAVTKGDTLRNHWRPAAPDYLTWHLLFDDRPTLHEVAERYQHVLEGVDGIDVVPTRWLHLTVQGVGPAHEITADNINALVAEACGRLEGIQPFELVFPPAEVLWEGIGLTAALAEPVSTLRKELRAAIATVCGTDRVPGADHEVLWPHVSLAYANGAVPAAELFDAIAALPREPVAVEIDQVALITLRREGRRTSGRPSTWLALGDRRPTSISRRAAAGDRRGAGISPAGPAKGGRRTTRRAGAVRDLRGSRSVARDG